MEKLKPLFSVGFHLVSIFFILDIVFFILSRMLIKIFPSSFRKDDLVILHKAATFASEDIQFLSLKKKIQSTTLVQYLVQSRDSTHCFFLKPCFIM